MTLILCARHLMSNSKKLGLGLRAAFGVDIYATFQRFMNRAFISYFKQPHTDAKSSLCRHQALQAETHKRQAQNQARPQ